MKNNLRQDPADRILDIAADLFGRFGFRRVTIEDVCSHAGIGKGTLYKYWKTREALYGAVLTRELLAVVKELLAAIYSDSRSILFHHVIRAVYSAMMRRPLLRAILTADPHMLSRSSQDDLSRVFQAQQSILFQDYSQILIQHGLLRGDLSPGELQYAVEATLIGFFVTDSILAEKPPLELERRADLLATMIQRSFEIDDSPPNDLIQIIASQVTRHFTKIVEENNLYLYQGI